MLRLISLVFGFPCEHEYMNIPPSNYRSGYATAPPARIVEEWGSPCKSSLLLSPLCLQLHFRILIVELGACKTALKLKTYTGIHMCATTE
jgi:hypothetical protein